MSKLALGIIETVGLAAAIEAADAAVKSANIEVIGYELTKGDGMATVKIQGNVGAVNAAIDAATIAATKVNKVWSKIVIPRPSDGLDMLVCSDETVGLERNEEVITEKIEEVITNEMREQIEEETKKEIQEEIEVIEIKEQEKKKKVIEKSTCNICKDPKCPRKKGDLRKMCIHYDELKKEGGFKNESSVRNG